MNKTISLLIVASLAFLLSGCIKSTRDYWKARANSICTQMEHGEARKFTLLYEYDYQTDSWGSHLEGFTCADGTKYVYSEFFKNYTIDKEKK